MSDESDNSRLIEDAIGRSPNNFESPMPDTLIDASPRSKVSGSSYGFNYSNSESSNNSDDLHEDSEQIESSNEKISVKANDLAKSQIKKIENEMKKMHQKHCQLLKDMDGNYAAIEQETHQRYIEFISKWKDQLKQKIEQYRKVIESLNMEISELKDYNSNSQEKINKVITEKNNILEKYNKEISEKDSFREKELASLQSSYEKQIKSTQKEKIELQQKVEELLAQKETMAQTIEAEKNEKINLKNSLNRYKSQEKEIILKFQDLETHYAADVSGLLLESLMKKLEDNEKIKETAYDLKKDIEKARKKKSNFKRQITQWVQDFEKNNGRPCENADKEQIKHLYAKYIDTNKKHDLLVKKFETMKHECNEKKINIDERNPTPFKMRSRSPSGNLNVSVDSVVAAPLRERERKTPREDSNYKDKADSLEKENAQLRKEVKSKISVSGRNPNQIPTSVANNIIHSASSMELQQLKAERDQLKNELLKFQQVMREPRKEMIDSMLIETQKSLEQWRAKASDLEKNLQVAQDLIEKYKQDYGKLIEQITESQESDNAELSTLKSQLAYCNSELIMYRDKLISTDSQFDLDLMYQKKKLLDENSNLNNEIKHLKVKISNILQENQTKIKEMEELRIIQANKEQEFKDSIRQRKLLHNQLEDLRGKIRVFCRVRPMSEEENKSGCSNIVTISDDFSVNIEAKPGLVKTYMYDTVFGPKATQEEVFEDTRRLIQSAVDGFNVCIFAYGQTGSGKTYTIQGYPGRPGIALRGIDELFAIVSNLPQSYACVVSCYMVELHVLHLIDLLRPKTREAPPQLTIKTDSKGMVYIPEVHLVTVESSSHMKVIYEEGIKSRHTSKTKMNDSSSRSHLIFCVLIEATNQETGTRTVGKLCFVDLAGSERLSRSEATAESLKETNAINKSLSALGDVISALLNKVSHIPYRNNKLTMLMSDFIGGTAKTLMFVNISPASTNREETMTSLYYGSRVKLITNEPVKNIESKELSRLRAEIAQASAQRDYYKNMLIQANLLQQTYEEQSDENR
jgi:Kinesin motor domain